MMQIYWGELFRQTFVFVFLFTVSSCSIVVVGDATIYAGLIPDDDDSTSTPFPNAIKCYVCKNYNNEQCNLIAVDAFCPQGTQYCITQHILNSTSGASIDVLKKCARENECSEHTVGCYATFESDVEKCVSCCEWSTCNVDVPTNSSTAIFSTLTPLTVDNSSQHIYSSSKLLFLLTCIAFVNVLR